VNKVSGWRILSRANSRVESSELMVVGVSLRMSGE